MFQKLINTIKVHKTAPFVLLGAMLGFFILGVGIVCAVMSLDSTATTWVTMGSAFAAFGLVCYEIAAFLTYRQNFMLALSLGRTRKEFLILYALEQIFWLGTGYLALLGLTALEQALYRVLFPWASMEFTMMPILTNWRIVLPLIPALLVVQMFLGSMYSRYGKPFGWVLYFVWMALCLGGPRIALHLESAGNASPLAWVPDIPAAGWIGVGIAAACGCLAATIHLGMKEQVH